MTPQTFPYTPLSSLPSRPKPLQFLPKDFSTYLFQIFRLPTRLRRSFSVGFNLLVPSALVASHSRRSSAYTDPCPEYSSCSTSTETFQCPRFTLPGGPLGLFLVPYTRRRCSSVSLIALNSRRSSTPPHLHPDAPHRGLVLLCPSTRDYVRPLLESAQCSNCVVW